MRAHFSSNARFSCLYHTANYVRVCTSSLYLCSYCSSNYCTIANSSTLCITAFFSTYQDNNRRIPKDSRLVGVVRPCPLVNSYRRKVVVPSFSTLFGIYDPKDDTMALQKSIKISQLALRGIPAGKIKSTRRMMCTAHPV